MGERRRLMRAFLAALLVLSSLSLASTVQYCTYKDDKCTSAPTCTSYVSGQCRKLPIPPPSQDRGYSELITCASAEKGSTWRFQSFIYSDVCLSAGYVYSFNGTGAGCTEGRTMDCSADNSASTTSASA